jgi:hypothetical protein
MGVMMAPVLGSGSAPAWMNLVAIFMDDSFFKLQRWGNKVDRYLTNAFPARSIRRLMQLDISLILPEQYKRASLLPLVKICFACIQNADTFGYSIFFTHLKISS